MEYCAHVRKVGILTASLGVTCGIHSLRNLPACVTCFYSLKIQLLYPADNVILIPAWHFKQKSCCSLTNQKASSWALLCHSGSDCGDSAAVWSATSVKTIQLGKKLWFTPFFSFAVRNLLLFLQTTPRGSGKKWCEASVKRNSNDRCPCKVSRHFNAV